MSIVDKLTPVYYYPISLVVQIRPDETLTTASLSFHTDIRILNADGQPLGTDHPTPQITPQQLSAFLTWVQTNLTAYQTAIGLQRYTEEAGE